MTESVRELLERVANDPTTKPRLAGECLRFALMFRVLGIEDARDAIVFLIGNAAGERDRAEEYAATIARLSKPN